MRRRSYWVRMLDKYGCFLIILLLVAVGGRAFTTLSALLSPSVSSVIQAAQATPLHAFRRTFAISYLRAGGDIYSLQKLMGHKDLRTLLRYLKLSDADLRQMHARFSPGDRL